MKSLLVAVFYALLVIAESKASDSSQRSQLDSKSLRSAADIEKIATYITHDVKASLVAIKTIVNNEYLCNGILFTNKHALAPTLCFFIYPGKNYGEYLVWVGVYFNFNNPTSRRIADVKGDNPMMNHIAVVIFDEPVQLSRTISVIHLSHKFPSKFAATIGYNQKKGCYEEDCIHDFEYGRPMQEYMTETTPLLHYTPLPERPPSQKMEIGVHNLFLGHPLIVYGKLFGLFLDSQYNETTGELLRRDLELVHSATPHVKDIIYENELLNSY